MESSEEEEKHDERDDDSDSASETELGSHTGDDGVTSDSESPSPPQRRKSSLQKLATSAAVRRFVIPTSVSF